MFRRLFSTAASSATNILAQAPLHKLEPTAIQEALNNAPYFVARTRLGRNLPVYVDYKHGGSKVITVIRRIYGDLTALRTELSQILPSGTEIKVRPEMQRIVVKGLHVDLIRAFLTHRGF